MSVTSPSESLFSVIRRGMGETEAEMVNTHGTGASLDAHFVGLKFDCMAARIFWDLICQREGVRTCPPVYLVSLRRMPLPAPPGSRSRPFVVENLGVCGRFIPGRPPPGERFW